MNTVSTKKPNHMESEKSNNEKRILVDNTIIAIFTKLLASKIVANKRSELFFNSKIHVSFRSLLAVNSSISFGNREKNATSEADTKAEHNNKTKQHKIEKNKETYVLLTYNCSIKRRIDSKISNVLQFK